MTRSGETVISFSRWFLARAVAHRIGIAFI
jgi:hypothetical protein